MKRTSTRITRTPRARQPRSLRDTQSRAALVFRDFVRQLEKLDAKPRTAARGAAR